MASMARLIAEHGRVNPAHVPVRPPVDDIHPSAAAMLEHHDRSAGQIFHRAFEGARVGDRGTTREEENQEYGSAS